MNAEQSVSEAPERVQQQQAESSGTQSHEDGGGSAFESEGGDEGQRGQSGLGQSKSSRRRRRKRKGKSEEGGAQAGSEGGEGGSVESVHAGEGESFASAPTVLPGESLAARQPAGGGSNGNQAGGQNVQQPAQQQQPRGFGGPASNQGQNNAPGTKRWKKKFRDRERPGGGRNDNPGNNFAQGGGGQQNGNGYAQQNGGGGGQRGQDTHQPGNNAFKRKGGSGGGFGGGSKQRSGGGGGGSRGGFVGPMDHSYRAPNGNVFDPSASTVEQGGRRSSHQGDSQPIDYSQGRAIPIKEGAPTRIYFFIEDLFFTAKISETARKLGVKVAFIKNEKEQIAALTSGTEEERPALIVFDLNNANAKPMTLIPKLKTKLKKSTSIIGFLSTLQGELRAKAVEAGCDTVMPRAAFSQNLPNLLRRYGIEDVEDHTNYNQ